MKQSKEILGKPIITIMSGLEMGIVKNFVINPDLRSIEFLVVQGEQWDFGIKAIPFKLVEGLGDYSVTIESERSIIDITDIPIANELLPKNIQIKNTRIITKKGNMLGQINEYVFCEESGKILGCYIDRADGEKMVLPEKEIITFGKEITIVADGSENHLMKEDEFYQSLFPAKQLEQDAVNESAAVVEKEIAELEMDTVVEQEFAGFGLDELVGETIQSDFYDLDGTLLAAEGTIVTEELVRIVKTLGNNKVLELTLKVEE
ncbi:hypothetical protein [Brevibacillus sp. SYSU BS000544]|uniref:PRC-barrel domain-containing protein n=1 Tax=Brevibacillus sp. SYSU BS000544 TaxID=3416443 RepID=UPI003CE56060